MNEDDQRMQIVLRLKDCSRRLMHHVHRTPLHNTADQNNNSAPFTTDTRINETDVDAQNLCEALEMVFFHGMIMPTVQQQQKQSQQQQQQSYQNRLFNVANASDSSSPFAAAAKAASESDRSSPMSSRGGARTSTGFGLGGGVVPFWQLLERLERCDPVCYPLRNAIAAVVSAPSVLTQFACARAWIRQILNAKCMDTVVQHMLSPENKAVLRQFYYPEGILMQPQQSATVLLAVLRSFKIVSFNFNIDDASLNETPLWLQRVPKQQQQQEVRGSGAFTYNASTGRPVSTGNIRSHSYAGENNNNSNNNRGSSALDSFFQSFESGLSSLMGGVDAAARYLNDSLETPSVPHNHQQLGQHQHNTSDFSYSAHPNSSAQSNLSYNRDDTTALTCNSFSIGGGISGCDNHISSDIGSRNSKSRRMDDSAGRSDRSEKSEANINNPNLSLFHPDIAASATGLAHEISGIRGSSLRKITPFFGSSLRDLILDEQRCNFAFLAPQCGVPTQALRLLTIVQKNLDTPDLFRRRPSSTAQVRFLLDHLESERFFHVARYQSSAVTDSNNHPISAGSALKETGLNASSQPQNRAVSNPSTTTRTAAHAQFPSTPGVAIFDIYTVAFVLLQWLNQLPEPLFGFEQHAAILACMQNVENERERIRNIRLLANQTAWYNKPLLANVLLLLEMSVGSSQMREKNGLNLVALAVLTTPCLLRSDEMRYTYTAGSRISRTNSGDSVRSSRGFGIIGKAADVEPPVAAPPDAEDMDRIQMSASAIGSAATEYIIRHQQEICGDVVSEVQRAQRQLITKIQRIKTYQTQLQRPLQIMTHDTALIDSILSEGSSGFGGYSSRDGGGGQVRGAEKTHEVKRRSFTAASVGGISGMISRKSAELLSALGDDSSPTTNCNNNSNSNSNSASSHHFNKNQKILFTSNDTVDLVTFLWQALRKAEDLLHVDSTFPFSPTVLDSNDRSFLVNARASTQQQEEDPSAKKTSDVVADSHLVQRTETESARSHQQPESQSCKPSASNPITTCHSYNDEKDYLAGEEFAEDRHYLPSFEEIMRHKRWEICGFVADTPEPNFDDSDRDVAVRSGMTKRGKMKEGEAGAPLTDFAVQHGFLAMKCLLGFLTKYEEKGAAIVADFALNRRRYCSLSLVCIHIVQLVSNVLHVTPLPDAPTPTASSENLTSTQHSQSRSQTSMKSPPNSDKTSLHWGLKPAISAAEAAVSGVASTMGMQTHTRTHNLYATIVLSKIELETMQQLARFSSWTLLNDERCFQEVFDLGLLSFDDAWKHCTVCAQELADGNTFPKAMFRARNMLWNVVDSQKPRSVSAMWEIWTGYRGREQERHFDTQTPHLKLKNPPKPMGKHTQIPEKKQPPILAQQDNQPRTDEKSEGNGNRCALIDSQAETTHARRADCSGNDNNNSNNNHNSHNNHNNNNNNDNNNHHIVRNTIDTTRMSESAATTSTPTITASTTTSTTITSTAASADTAGASTKTTDSSTYVAPGVVEKSVSRLPAGMAMIGHDVTDLLDIQEQQREEKAAYDAHQREAEGEGERGNAREGVRAYHPHPHTHHHHHMYPSEGEGEGREGGERQRSSIIVAGSAPSGMVAESTWATDTSAAEIQSSRLIPKTVSGIVTHVRGGARILSPKHIQQLESALPNAYQCYDWNLLFRMSIHGSSLSTVMTKAKNKRCTLLVIQDSKGAIFGALIPEYLKATEKDRYYGNGTIAVWTFVSGTLKFYPWSYKNSYFILCNRDALAFGGGGDFALYLDSDLNQGSSGNCATFNSPCLASDDQFTCHACELYSLDAPLLV